MDNLAVVFPRCNSGILDYQGESEAVNRKGQHTFCEHGKHFLSFKVFGAMHDKAVRENCKDCPPDNWRTSFYSFHISIMYSLQLA